MNNNKQFWRGFTWKRFMKNAFLFFVLSLVVSVIFNYFDKDDTVSAAFTKKELLKRFVLSVCWGFVMTLWHEPDPDAGKAIPPGA